jgi:hypothetical protein
VLFLPKICLLKYIIEGKVEGKIEVTGHRGRRRKQLRDGLKEMRGYWKLKEKVLVRSLWRTRFGGSYEPIVRQTTECNMASNIYVHDISVVYRS